MSNGKVGSRYRVTLADGSEFEVVTDERDWAAMEAKEFPLSAQLTMVRFNVWNAAKREGFTRRSWEQFNLTDCVSCEDISGDDEEESEGGQGLDPGRTTPNGPDGSTSQSPAASRSRGRGASSTGTRAT